MQGMKFTFTIFIGDDESIDEFTSYMGTLSWGVYGGCQLEVCPDTGRLHIQGFVVFDKNHRLSALKKLHSKAHWEKMKGTLEHNENYCSKKETRFEGSEPHSWGVRPAPSQQGHRTDIDRGTDIIRTTVGNVKKRMRALAENEPGVFVKFHRGFEALARTLAVESMDFVPEKEDFFDWQRKLYEELMEDPDDRTIHYIYDPVGKNGKSSLFRYFATHYRYDTICLNGKLDNMQAAYDGERYVFFVLPRANPNSPIKDTEMQRAYLYHFAEQLKDGFYMSGKYQSAPKYFRTPHVIFMSNDPPLEGLWTSDRIKLTQISENVIPLYPIFQP